MILTEELTLVFQKKLAKTGSLDAALTKALWVAYKAGQPCAGGCHEALDELHKLREAAQHYYDNCLRGESALCHDEKQQEALAALRDALDKT
jgi:hypothetical protein